MKKHLLLFLAFLALVFSAGAQATIILEAHNVWNDGTGYQLLLDADHNTYGSIIPTSGALTNGGDVPSSVYDEFEYTVPVGADGSLTTTNIVFDGTATITIPAGTYDFCITNPTPGDRMWIASEAADPTRADDYVFEDNTVYHFTMAKTSDGHDCTHLEITFIPTGPAIMASPSALLLNAMIGGEATASTTVTGFNLTSGITATTSAPFAVSDDNNSFGLSAMLPANGGTLHVQYSPSAAGTEEGYVILSSAGADDDTIFVTGNAIEAATLPYFADFENVEENAQWEFQHNGTNQWFIGSAVNNTLEGEKALYVSNDNGVSHAYTITTTSTTWAYRDIDFGQYNEYQLAFDYIGVGESSIYDNLKIYIGAPSDAIPTSSSSSGVTIPGATLLGTLNGISTWTRVTATLNSSFSGVQRVYLLWWNDSSVGTNPPAAVDNISIIGSNCSRPNAVAVSNVTAHTADVTFQPASSDDFEWEYVLCSDGLLPEDAIPESITDTSFSLTDLTHNTTYSLYIRTSCGNDEHSVWSPVAVFTTDPTCTSPINLTVSHITGTSALVSWEPAPFGATEYIFSYTEAGEDNWISETVEDNNFMLSGLEPQTSYEVSVTSVCEEGDAPAAVQTFLTKCLAGGDIQIGEGTTDYSYLPSYSLYEYSYTQQIYLANELNNASEIYSIAFDASAVNTPNRHLSIYLMNTSANTSTSWLNASSAQMVYDGDVTLVEGWNTFNFTTPFQRNTNDNLAVIVIDGTGSWSSSNNWHVHTTSATLASYDYQDDIPYSISTAPGSVNATTNRPNVIFGTPCDSSDFICVAPNAFVESISTDEITISWVPGYQETEWELEYKTSTTDWTSEGIVTTSPYTLEELIPNTLYTIRMRSVCGGDEYSNWLEMTARTECSEIATLPFVEEFDTYGTGTAIMPTCWTSLNTYSGSYPYITSTSYAGEGSLYFYAGTSGSYNTAITPPFASSLNVNTLQATFMYRATYSTDRLIVGVMSDPTNDNTFVAVDTIAPASTASTWTEKTVTFDSYTGEGQYIAFKNAYTSSYTYSYIDNLMIEEIPLCPKPSQVSAISTPTDTVILSWVGEGASTWDVIYGPTGFNPNNEEAENTILVEGVTDNPYTITGLSGGIGYDFYVRTSCDNGSVSDWSNIPASAYPFSYAMGITGSDTLTGCGFIITDNGGPNGNYSNNCDFTVVIYPSDYDSLVSISGVFEGEGNWDKLYIYDGISTNANDQVALIASTSQITFGPIVSESGPLTIRFTSDGSTFNAGFVAITSCVAAPNCPSPLKNSVSVSNIDGHNATVSFTDLNPDHTSWTVFYRPANADEEDPWMSVVTSEDSVDLNDLDPETNYAVYVITNCDVPDEVADATNTVHFTTAVACPAPQNLAVSNIGMTSATATWFSNAESFTIEYGEAGFTPGEGTTEIVTTNTFDLTGLESSTTYTVYVTADCGTEGNSQPATVNFSTTICEVENQCLYTFNLADSYGDGWNNGSLAVKQNGITIATISLSNGYSATESVSLCQNATTELVWTAGSYPDEASFTITDPYGAQMYASSSMTTGTSTVYTFTPNCSGCATPTNIMVSNIGLSSATVSWTGSADSYTIEYGETGFTPGTGTTTTVTSTTYDLTGLDAASSYTIYITSICTDDVSASVPVNFNTSFCDVTDQCTYTFIITDEYGDGWNEGYLTVEQNNLTVATLEAADNYDDPSSETITVSLCDNLSTSIVWHSGNYDSEAGFTLIGPDGSQLYTITDMGAYTTYTFTTDCNGSGPVTPTDPTVTTAAASNVTQTTATLNGSITNPDNVTITAKGFEWKTTVGGTYAPVTVTGNNLTYNLTNLVPNTGYTYKAFITFNGTTVYGSEMTFTTLPEDTPEPCDVPTNLHTTDIQNEAIAIAWDANANVSSWNIRYSTVGGTWNTATSNTNSYTITGLTGLTDYEIQVQANCGNGNLSEWSGSITAQTTNVGIEEHLLNSISLYPNPANDVVNVECTMNNVQLEGVEVIDVYGKVVRTIVGANNYSPIRINVSGLANGMYFVRVTTDEGVVSKNFIKR